MTEIRNPIKHPIATAKLKTGEVIMVYSLTPREVILINEIRKLPYGEILVKMREGKIHQALPTGSLAFWDLCENDS